MRSLVGDSAIGSKIGWIIKPSTLHESYGCPDLDRLTGGWIYRGYKGKHC